MSKVESTKPVGRRHGPLHWIGTAAGVLGGFVLGAALLRLSGVHDAGERTVLLLVLTCVEGGLFAYLAMPYLVRWWRGLDVLLKTTPLPDLLTAVVGMIVGLVVAVLISSFLRDLPFGGPLSFALGALLAFMGASLGLHRRGELLALARVSREQDEGRRLKKVLLDTSVIIDGRVVEVAATGFLDAPLVVLRSVLRELQLVADSSDPLRRNRGRRGLDVLGQLQHSPQVTLEVVDDDLPQAMPIDDKLVELGREHGWAVMTVDFNLNRVARLEGVEVLNLNDLAGAMRPIALPGEELTVTLLREGKEPGQGVGYLEDGTMVVVENGRRLLNQTVTATVVSVLQTSAGRMVFAQTGGIAEGRKGRQAVP